MNRLVSAAGRNTSLLITATIFVVLVIAVGDVFLTARNLENLTRQIAVDAPMVFAQTLVLLVGGIDLSVGTTMAMSAVLAIGLQEYGAVVACLGAVAFGATVGLVNGLLVTKARINPFIATLGTMSLTTGIMLTYTEQQPLSGTIEGFGWWGAGNLWIVPIPFVVSLLMAIILAMLLTQTRIGRNLYAVGGDIEAAYLAGISVDRVQIVAFVTSGTLASLSGILIAARLNSASVQLGNDAPLLTLSAALIGGASLFGGKGSVVGAFLGVIALGMLTNGMNLMGVETPHQIAIKALILVAVVGIDALVGRMAGRKLALSIRTSPRAQS